MALIELQKIDKTYRVGDVDLPVLKNVSLTVEAGEFVALTGASGSGKTSLMNLLGCLDRPTGGEYHLNGIPVNKLSPTRMSRLRSSQIGFVFQSFNLLPRASALENVCMPAAYSGERRSRRQVRQKGQELLATVGLKSRMHHPPSKLSGGEQQRVAIARSLVNNPVLLLADEPTGNLDSRTGQEILQLFRKLNEEQGITIILVTHDQYVANHADRVIRIADGVVVEDSKPSPTTETEESTATAEKPQVSWRRRRGTAGATRIALQAMKRNLMRTLLTMLGVIIGVAAVVSMMEISRGASVAIQVTVIRMGANTVAVFPGAPQRIGDKNQFITPQDAEAIRKECDSVVSAAPIIEETAQVIYGNRSWNPFYIKGSTNDFLEIRNWNELERGRTFTEREILAGSKVCLIGQTLVRELFEMRDPIGKEIRVKNVPFEVIGVLNTKGANLLGIDQDDILLAPWTTVKYRLSGSGLGGPAISTSARSLPGKTQGQRLPGSPHRIRTDHLDQIMVKLDSPDAVSNAVGEIDHLLRERHRIAASEPGFEVYDMAEVSNALKKTIRMMSGLGMSIAVISLIVGGVGIMNIMLVSVTERTREIGLRRAVGADAVDIKRQFLIESVVLCVSGGIIGILTGRTSSMLIGSLAGWPTSASTLAAVLAVGVSVSVGIIFGYYPAWKASRLNPIDALRYE